jgi:hypothetical protein
MNKKFECEIRGSHDGDCEFTIFRDVTLRSLVVRYQLSGRAYLANYKHRTTVHSNLWEVQKTVAYIFLLVSAHVTVRASRAIWRLTNIWHVHRLNIFRFANAWSGFFLSYHTKYLLWSTGLQDRFCLNLSQLSIHSHAVIFEFISWYSGHKTNRVINIIVLPYFINALQTHWVVPEYQMSERTVSLSLSMPLQPSGSWPLFQFLNPIRSR